LINYYEILGLEYGAGVLEIKASFRQLAKLYHPDKNPDGIEHFTKILKAYETLSDPVLKASYDYRLNYHQAQTQYQRKGPGNTTSNTKNWKFDERELKRRQYYNDHIKKYAKETSRFMAEAETKKNYNEFKYILFATPLAVILFLLIMHLATRDRHEIFNSPGTKLAASEMKDSLVSGLEMGDSPYTLFFGSPRYDKIHDQKLVVKNMTGMDVIVCLFTQKEFIRDFYIKNNYSAEVSQLPDEALYINYSSGQNFNRVKHLKEVDIIGGFTRNQLFFKSIKATSLHSINELTLLQGNNEGFETADEKSFFKRAKKQL
jgi:hypothetical protein